MLTLVASLALRAAARPPARVARALAARPSASLVPPIGPHAYQDLPQPGDAPPQLPDLFPPAPPAPDPGLDRPGGPGAPHPDPPRSPDVFPVPQPPPGKL
jgi:hypothetical protein